METTSGRNSNSFSWFKFDYKELSPIFLVFAVHVMWLDIFVSAPYLRRYFGKIGSKATYAVAGLAAVIILLTLATIGSIIPACVMLGKGVYRQNTIYDEIVQDLKLNMGSKPQAIAILEAGAIQLGMYCLGRTEHEASSLIS